MYVRTIEEKYVNRRWNTEQVRHRDVFECDECSERFTLYHKASHASTGALTFCPKPKDCNKRSRSTGKLAQKWKQTKLERYGVEHSSQVPGATEKMVATRVLKTGAKSPSQASSTSNAKFKCTMVERHGVEHPSLSVEVKQKKRATYKQRYGVNNPFSAGSPFRDPHAASRGGQEGYRALARSKNPWKTSKPERLLIEFFERRYGEVERQVKIAGPPDMRKYYLVDAYIKALDVYVELDGVFWHGLNKPYSELHTKQRTVYDRDRAQDEWFRLSGRRLVRVTDKELLACYANDDFTTIIAKVG